MPSMTPDLRIVGPRSAAGLRRISGIRFSAAGLVSRGRAGIGGSGISSAGSRSSRASFQFWARSVRRWGQVRAPGRHRDPARPDRTSLFPAAAQPAGVARGIGCSERGAGRGSGEPASRPGDQTFGSSADSTAGGIAGRCGERGDSGASSVSSTIGGSDIGRRHRCRGHWRCDRLGFRAQPIQRAGRRLAGGGGEMRLGRVRRLGRTRRFGGGRLGHRWLHRAEFWLSGAEPNAAPIRPSSRYDGRVDFERLGDPPQLAKHERQPDQDQGRRRPRSCRK